MHVPAAGAVGRKATAVRGAPRRLCTLWLFAVHCYCSLVGHLVAEHGCDHVIRSSRRARLTICVALLDVCESCVLQGEDRLSEGRYFEQHAVPLNEVREDLLQCFKKKTHDQQSPPSTVRPSKSCLCSWCFSSPCVHHNSNVTTFGGALWRC